jgi:hypothetical protein
MQIQNDERMTVPEIAALVGVTEQAVRYWAKRGLYLNWQRSVNNRVFALRPEVEELARGYIGRRPPPGKCGQSITRRGW